MSRYNNSPEGSYNNYDSEFHYLAENRDIAACCDVVVE